MILVVELKLQDLVQKTFVLLCLFVTTMQSLNVINLHAQKKNIHLLLIFFDLNIDGTQNKKRKGTEFASDQYMVIVIL